MKKWLKYGLIGLVIGIIGLLGELLGKFVWHWFLLLSYLNIPSFFILSSLLSLFFTGTDASWGVFIIGRWLAPITYFIIGAVIGLIVQKIKK